MDKFNLFFEKWKNVFIVAFFCLIYLGQCSTNRTITKLEKDKVVLTSKVDSFTIILKSFKPITNNDLKIEGLKSEKRMIQATDRKMLDVKRQSEIDIELEKLQGK